ncbi:MAG: type III-A CRISPR-associated protein Csm2 [Proteobacteria bacterium]|nr:type III-A CRISPR-associated protein Csm2 [Pseudomonadota bacterium]MBU4288735.1 type III-A CRISPR-associated protein Csm2 [Pseudomonadota bacterium]MCG2830390.1 type III-A CRISPR-associated protein Csm2 [Desulfobacteraceae bacterium]
MDSFFYKDKEKRILKPTLFSDTAEELSGKIYNSGLQKKKDGKPELKLNKRTQLRKFYDEVIRLNSLANSKANPEAWDNILPYVNMLIAKAVYAEGRGNVTKDFTDFMKESIREIRDSKDLLVFANFFEAFMGFYRKYGA